MQQIEATLNDLTAQYSEHLGNEIFSTHVMAIQATIAEIQQRKNVLSVITYDESGMMLVASAKAEQENLTEEEAAALQSSSTARIGKWQGQSVLTFASPIVAYGENVGFWKIHYSLATMNRQTLEIILIFAALILSSAILIGLLLNSIMVRSVLHPVYVLRNAMQHIQGTTGEMESQSGKPVKPQRLDMMIAAFDELPEELLHPHAAGDEIGSLAFSFQRMLFALKNAYAGIRTDALTGLYNRLKLDEAMNDEINRLQRYQGTFSVIMMDIDHFKKVNDTHGHLVGDEVLKKIAEILKAGFRKTDTPGRWGGEEFLVLLPQQDMAQAVMLAEKLRATIENTTVAEINKVTSSFGVTGYMTEDTVESLVKRADFALYRAKELGRNRVEILEPENVN
jgi:diguanylate cyclase (GGDEF)-like protein